MIDVREVVSKTFKDYFKNLLEKDVDLNRRKVATQLVFWLVNDARKRPVADLDRRIADMTRRIDEMVKEMEIEFKDGKLVVKVTGSADATLRMLRRGTTWFDGTDELEDHILAGIFGNK